MLWNRAAYLGPPDGNWGGTMSECRGLVLHIAEGSYEGTIGWMRNPASDVSSHFVLGLGGFDTGEVAQMLDTSLTAWTQGMGNGHWVSVENAGFWTGQFTPQQIEANAQLYAWLMQTHGVPAVLANTPSERGLGWHGMGGVAWGNHPNCPGPINVSLRSTILARAQQIVNGEEEDMTPEQNRILLNLANVISGWSIGADEVNQTFPDGSIKLVNIAGLYEATAALVECDGGGGGGLVPHVHSLPGPTGPALPDDE